LRKAGRREDRDNSLTKTIKELQDLETEYKKFDKMAGKSDYDKAMSQYAQELETATKAIEEAKKTIVTLDNELVGFDK
jgi:predicted  nucleic acid-binding Zn-ribbon protein